MTSPRVALGAVALLMACGSDAPGPTSTDPPGPAETEEAAAAVRAALDVRARGCGPTEDRGVGSLIDEGLAVTVAHVVAGTDEVEVIDTQGSRASAVVVHFDPDLDLAVLRTDPDLGVPLEPREDAARSGESGVLVVPRLVDDEMRIDVAEVDVVRPARILTTDIYRQDDVTREGFEMEATVREGDSGAMVVLPDGGAGVLWARSNQRPERAWAVDLPAELLDPDARAALTDAVDTGRCDG